MLVEHVRNVVGQPEATHAEYGEPGLPVISPLACPLRGALRAVDLVPETRLGAAHGVRRSEEVFSCGYGLDEAARAWVDTSGLRTSAVDLEGRVVGVERADHPFFVGTLYQPQRRSGEGHPHPVVVAFVDAARRASRSAGR